MAREIVLVFVHGWSVTSKDTYGGLPEAIQAHARDNNIQIETRHIYLGRYISFHDEVAMDDLARAMEYAVQNDLQGVREFSCITHSTGGPLVRRWIDLHYGAKRLSACPLRHLIMLAPANHGSALAIIGKGRLSRIKAWFQGVEPGQRVLDWLCLGSNEAWELQDSFTGYTLENQNVYPFVLSGETIDPSFYDFLNAYLVEKGSDGVIRLTAANLNYSFFRLEQSDERYDDGGGNYILVDSPGKRRRPPKTAFGVIPGASHSGTKIGIMRSVTPDNAHNKPVVDTVIQCLKVNTWLQYEARIDELESETDRQQHSSGHSRCVMFIFRIRDDAGDSISDYDLLLLGREYDPDKLPKGFFIDVQKNPRSNALTYYLNYDVLSQSPELGIRVTARPEFSKPGKTPERFSGYTPCEFRFSGGQVSRSIKPNETVYVDIVLKRCVDREAFRFDPLSDGKRSFKKVKPSGKIA